MSAFDPKQTLALGAALGPLRHHIPSDEFDFRRIAGEGALLSALQPRLEGAKSDIKLVILSS